MRRPWRRSAAAWRGRAGALGIGHRGIDIRNSLGTDLASGGTACRFVLAAATGSEQQQCEGRETKHHGWRIAQACRG